MIPSPGTSWEVKARAHVCSATGEPFTDGQTIVSRLITTANGLQRDDFGVAQWDKEKEAASRFFWKTVYHPPAPKKQAPFREENAAEAVQELMAEKDPANTNTLFILAAMLERKRLWVEQGIQTDEEGHRIRIYENKETGETYFIVDPQISLENLAALQDEVAKKLGWIKPEPPAPEPESAETESEEEPNSEEAVSNVCTPQNDT